MDANAHAHPTEDDFFNREVIGLPDAIPSNIIELDHGDSIEMIASPVRKRIGDAEVRLLAYNGSVPGPTLRVHQGTSITVNFTNQIDLESTIHWHGLRLDNRFDGTHETQAPVEIGGSFTYRLEFPDPGVYWYHPHIREDYGQEMGLYGNVVVVPRDPDYWPPVHREITLTLDDILLEDGKVAAFSQFETTYTAMGRFGNVMLVAGEPRLLRSANRGEVIRFYLTNTANTRVFNVGMNRARVKLIGGDSGRCEHEEFVDSVMLAPSERAVVDVMFDHPGDVTFEHRTPNRTYELGTISVGEEPATPPLDGEFDVLRSDPELAAERERMEHYVSASPDRTLAFVARMNLGEPDEGVGPASYTCPMHPEIVSETPGSCPKCGMKLLPSNLTGSSMHEHGESKQMGHGSMTHELHHGGHEHQQHGHQAAHEHQQHGHHHAGHEHHSSGGIEWEDEMVEMNRMTTPANMRWLLQDRETGNEGHAIRWQFRVGDRAKIRLVNDMDSDHPMHHPFHIHGAGRFLILSRDGEVEPNLMWKDTVLVPTGQTVDILLDVTNPGIWMAHCHIAEHHEGGMMLSFEVVD